MWRMFHSAPVASIGLDEIIIGLIIFGSIVSRIMNARSADAKAKPADVPTPRPSSGRKPPPAPSPKRISEAQSELEAFLNTLNNAATQQLAQETAPKPPPPPPPQVKTQPRTPAPTVQRPAPARTPTKVRQKRVRVEPEIRRPIGIRRTRLEECEDDRRHTYKEITIGGHAYCDGAEKRRALVNAIADDLVDSDSIRKAVVLKEILGPPLALRNNAA